MPLKLIRRGNIWHMHGVVRASSTGEGVAVRESTHTEDRDLAEARRAAREAELYAGLVVGRGVPTGFDAAVLSYLEHEPRSERTRAIVARLTRHFGRLDVSRIGQSHADDACRSIVGAHATPATKMRSVITPLSAILQHAHLRGWCEAPKLQRMRVPVPTPAWLTPAEAERLVDAAAPHLGVLLEFLLCTGARLSEALYLPWSDVDLAAARVVFRAERTKAGRERAVTLPPRAVAALLRIPQRDGMVFRRDDGEPYAHRDLGGGQISTGFAAACRRASLGRWEARILDAGPGRRWVPSISPHDLRHSWASWSYALHRDPIRLRHEGGWSTILMVERYAHRTPLDLVPAIRAFWRLEQPRQPMRETA